MEHKKQLLKGKGVNIKAADNPAEYDSSSEDDDLPYKYDEDVVDKFFDMH